MSIFKQVFPMSVVNTPSYTHINSQNQNLSKRCQLSTVGQAPIWSISLRTIHFNGKCLQSVCSKTGMTSSLYLHLASATSNCSLERFQIWYYLHFIYFYEENCCLSGIIKCSHELASRVLPHTAS